MTFDDLKIWLVLGLTPYRIHKQHISSGLHHVEIRALFWTFTIKKRPSGRHDWTLQISLIEKLRQAVWAAVMHWKDGKLSDIEGTESRN